MTHYIRSKYIIVAILTALLIIYCLIQYVAICLLFACSKHKPEIINIDCDLPAFFKNNMVNSLKRSPPLYIKFQFRTGRLGNEMFQYAALLGVARRNNRKPVWQVANSTLERSFDIGVKVDGSLRVTEGYESTYVPIYEEHAYAYNNETEALPNENITLSGYFQSRLYFIHVEEELRREFTFSEDIRSRAQEFIDTALPYSWIGNNFTIVAIHVRRGDMLHPMFVNKGWTPIEPDYFKRSMNYFKSRFDLVLFVVLSDEISWCQQNIVGNNVVYSEGQTAAEDLAIASLCDHAIITVGSFGLWVAWFADGTTIRPANVPTIGSKLYHQLKNATHYYPKNSIVL